MILVWLPTALESWASTPSQGLVTTFMREFMILFGIVGYLLGRRSYPNAVGETVSDPDEIEVGALGSELRFWRAKEALRQGERSLDLEATLLSGTLSQATTMLGWIVTGTTAAAALAISPSAHPEWKLPATLVAFGLIAPAIICIYVVFPRRGVQIEGFDAPQILLSGHASELEQLEGMAKGLFDAVRATRKRLLISRRLLAIAWILFTAIPVAVFIFMEWNYLVDLLPIHGFGGVGRGPSGAGDG
jgi:hypothetical protein